MKKRRKKAQTIDRCSAIMADLVDQTEKAFAQVDSLDQDDPDAALAVLEKRAKHTLSVVKAALELEKLNNERGEGTPEYDESVVAMLKAIAAGVDNAKLN